MQRLREKIAALPPNTRSPVDPYASGLTNVTLRDYQLAGLAWLHGCYKLVPVDLGSSCPLTSLRAGHGAILGDEMGLGKTAQSVSLLATLPESLSLVVAPLSTLSGWQAELKNAPHLRVLAYVGDKDERLAIQESAVLSGPGRSVDVCLTTYEYILRDTAFFASTKWTVLVVDEAHRLKNSEAQLYTVLTDDVHANFKLLLTGTPVQNNLSELFSLASFIAPSIFKPRIREEFLDEFAALESKSGPSSDKKAAQAVLHEVIHVSLRRFTQMLLIQILLPFLLRRTKTEVLAMLPQKSEVVVYTGVTALQKKLYKGILVKDSSIFGGGQSKSRVLNTLMQVLPSGQYFNRQFAHTIFALATEVCQPPIPF